jgi:hypothetical protein
MIYLLPRSTVLEAFAFEPDVAQALLANLARQVIEPSRSSRSST